MLKKVVLISGGAAVGKTAVLKNIIPLLQSKDLALSVCKIDCVATRDGLVYQNMNIPHVVGIAVIFVPTTFWFPIFRSCITGQMKNRVMFY